MHHWHLRIVLLTSLVAIPAATETQDQRSQPRRGGDARQPLIVSCRRPCTAVTDAVQRMGGRVTQRFANVDAVAVEVPLTRLPDLVTVAGPAALQKDAVVMRPLVPTILNAAAWRNDSLRANSSSRGTSPAIPAAPSSFDYLGGAQALHAAGKIGEGVIVAVIEGGVSGAPMTAVRSQSALPGEQFQVPVAGTSLWADPLRDTVIGGESLVPPDIDPYSATHFGHAHGTGVSVMIAGHGALAVPNDEPFLQSMQAHRPNDVFPCPGPPYEAPCGPNTSIVSMVGAAPGAKIYSLKVGGGAASGLLAGLDRAITLRRNYNRGVPSVPVGGDGSPENPFVYDSLRIDVANMSLSFYTLFAGRNLVDQMLLQMLEVGIVPVVAAGNASPAAMTGGAPGTSFGALTVGAASLAGHQRVFGDVGLGLGVGLLFRPTGHTQTADFSSRGPTSDGRIDPDVMAQGGHGSLFIAPHGLTGEGAIVHCLSPVALPGTCEPTVTMWEGTSFAAPIVAGAAALLRREVPDATAVQIRNALHMSANPKVFGDHSGPIDRGAGYIDVPKALHLLKTGQVSNILPDLETDRRKPGEDLADDLGHGGRSVIRNVMEAGFTPVEFRNDRHTERVTNLGPGQTAHLFIPSDPWTTRLTLEISDVTSNLPPDQHNPVVGEWMRLHWVDAPTHAERTVAPLSQESIPVGSERLTRVVDHPQTGLLRLALRGEHFNVGRVSATVTIVRERDPNPWPAAAGPIKQDDFLWFEVDVPRGTRNLTAEAAWAQNWSRYPTNDIDMYAIDPGGAIYNSATLSSPERTLIVDPAPGRWRILLHGFEIFRRDGTPDDPDTMRGRVDAFKLYVAADGSKLRARPCPTCELP